MPTLVIGGGGFVGLNVVNELIGQRERVVIFDRIDLPPQVWGRVRQAGADVTVVLGDVRDPEALKAVVEAHDIDRLIHAAVITAGPVREIREPGEIVDVNVQGTVNVLRAARNTNCRRILYISSGAAYGRTLFQETPIHEEVSASSPETVYGITKLAAEQMALRLAVLWELDVICIRLGSVFGPWEFDTGVRDRLTPHLQIAQMALCGRTAILPKREVTRDWVYSLDVAAGLVRILQTPRPQHNVYHLSSGGGWEHVIGLWCEMLKKEYPRFSWRMAANDEVPNVNYHADRDRASMAITRLRDDIGFTPRFGMRKAYCDYLDWIQANHAFINMPAIIADQR